MTILGSVFAGRVRLAGLSGAERTVAQLSLAALVAGGLIVVAHGTGAISLPTSEALKQTVQPTAAVVALLALAAGGTALVMGALRPGGPPVLLTLPVVALVTAAIAGTLLRTASVLEVYRRVLIGRSLAPEWLVDLARASAWLSFACAAGLLAGALFPRLRSRRVAVWLVALPPLFLLVLLALVAVFAEYPSVVRLHGLAQPTDWLLSGAGLVLTQVSLALLGLVAWQVVVGVGATQKLAAARATRLAGRSRLALGLLGLKGIWLVLGLSGVLWSVLGGSSPSWAATRDNDLIAWTIAVMASLAAAAWLMRGRVELHDRALPALGGALSLGITWPFVAGSLVILVLAIVTTGVVDSAKSVVEVGNWIIDHTVLAPRYAIAGAALVAVALLPMRRLRSWAVLLALFAAWSTPAFIATYAHHHVSYVTRTSTLDIALTGVLGAALLCAYHRHDRQLQERIVLVLLVSSVLAWGGAISSGLIGANATAHLTLLIPVVWTFLFHAGSLNRDSPKRSGRLLQALGLAAVTLALAAYQLAIQPPGAGDVGAVIRFLVVPAFAATLVAVTVSAWRSGGAPDPEERYSS